MLSVDVDAVRLFLHLLAATVWVGGQVVLVSALPVLRGVSTEAVRAAATGYNRVAWPAFVVLIATGTWNIAAEGDKGAAYQHTLTIKLLVVALSGAAAFGHTRVSSPRSRGLLAALAGLTALLALFLGVLLAE
jgi:putative copper export protein